MATSDVLQFNCSIENEVARKAAKNFAGMLGKAFENYKKLWNEYLKLRKYCEDANIKIPFQLLESESDNKDIVTLSQTHAYCEKSPNKLGHTSENATKFTAANDESVTNRFNSDTMSSLDDSVSSDNKSTAKHTEEKLLRSPILVKSRSKSKKTNATHGHFILDDSGDHSPCIPIKENIFISTNDCHEDSANVSVEHKENQYPFMGNNSDRIECTPISKGHRKLGISNLYNVDTILLQNGKKLKQSKLVFLPNEQTTDNKIYKEHKQLNPLTSYISPTSKENIKEESTNLCESKLGEDEIIEESPTMRTNSKLKIKNLKLNRKNAAKVTGKSGKRKNDIFDKHNDITSDTKLSSIKVDQASLSQRLLTVHTSTQKAESYLIKRSKIIDSSDNEIIRSKTDVLGFPSSPIIATSEHLFPEDIKRLSTSVKETKPLQIIENGNQAQKRKFSETIKQVSDYNSSVCNDETYCAVGENLKRQAIFDVNKLEDIEEKMSENVLPDSPLTKKCFMNSFDILPERKEACIDKPSKNKSERSKMTGVTCWECKKTLNLLC
ncbi:uncharacterized protein LOC122398358 isoform X2 [Colletes gigas]|uniref:uncharacterized protein LOC122398358 isoform X2 n=1 Tax=Colletes gigas TaxID=935657 RepID=UPI001C9B2D00|nr:uncharacterized protein LOC122398358 isoform X2 [Colletes gigas]